MPQSVLVGASLAVGLAMWADRRRKGEEQDWQARTPRARSLLTAIGVIGMVVSAILYTTVHSDQAFAYRGGFLLAAIAASAVLLSVSCAQFSPVAKLSGSSSSPLSGGCPMACTSGTSRSSRS